jgi:catechol 2,3-dioxygenase-like lactoylglutathione lyase family enzyme
MAIEIAGAAPLFTVYDVPTSVAFYRDLLGFEVIHHSKPFTDAKDDYGWALLRLNGVELMLNNAYEDNIRPPQPDSTRNAWHKDVCLYMSCRDVDGTYAYLRSRSVDVNEPRVAYYGMKQLYLSDPDGYSLCFQRPATDEEMAVPR